MDPSPKRNPSIIEGPLIVDDSDVTVVSESPRLLILLITKGNTKLAILSGHCPHAGRTAEREAFLDQLAVGLQRVKHAHLVLGGIDRNGRVPANYPNVSGDAEFADSDETGWAAVALFADAGIWLPSMYSSLHWRASHVYPSQWPATQD